MFSLRTTPLLVFAFSFLSSCVAQDGFTWWVNPNSTSPITLQEGETVTLQWVTDFPEFNVVLYQNLGDNYGEFVSEYLLEEVSGISSYDWTVAPIQDNTMNGNLSFHFDLILAGNDENGANSQEFLIQPNGNSSSPTSSYPTYAYSTASASAAVTSYEPDPYSVLHTTVTTAEGSALSTIIAYETITSASYSSEVPNPSDGFVTATTSAVVHLPTAAGGNATVSTRSYSSTVTAAQQTGTQTATASGPTVSAFTGEGTRNRNGWEFAVVAAVGGMLAAL